MNTRRLPQRLSTSVLFLALCGAAWSAPPPRASSYLPAPVSAAETEPGPETLGGFGCSYAFDDGTAETDVGLVTSGTLGAAVVFDQLSCRVLDTITVAWGPHSGAPQAATLAVYNDPNQDGDPSDITAADLLVQAAVTTNATGVLTDYPITPIVISGKFVVVAITDDNDGGGETDHPLRLDQSGGSIAGTTPTAGSWWLGGISDVNEPFSSAVVLGPVGNFSLPGDWLLRANGNSGVCCTVYGCELLTQADCSNAAGSFLGDNTECALCEMQTVPIRDVNGDGVEDLVVLLPGSLVPTTLTAGGGGEGGDGGVAGAGGTGAQVLIKDSDTGLLIQQINIDPDFDPIDIAVVPHFAGSAADEVAILTRKFDGSIVRMFVRDASTGLPVNTIGYNATFDPIALAVVSSFGGTGADELAVLMRRPTDGANRVFIKDASSDLEVGVLGFNINFAMAKIESVPSFGETAADEVAVMGISEVTAVTRVFIKDADNDLQLGNPGLGNTFPPVDFEIVEDIGGTAAPEVAILSRRPTDGLVRVWVKDGTTGLLISNPSYGNTFVPRDLEVAAMDTLGALVESLGVATPPELGVLERNPGTGVSRVRFLDALTGTDVSTTTYTASFFPLDVAIIDDFFAGTVAPEVGVLERRLSDGFTWVRIRDGGDNSLVGNVMVP